MAHNSAKFPIQYVDVLLVSIEAHCFKPTNDCNSFDKAAIVDWENKAVLFERVTLSFWQLEEFYFQ